MHIGSTNTDRSWFFLITLFGVIAIASINPILFPSTPSIDLYNVAAESAVLFITLYANRYISHVIKSRRVFPLLFTALALICISYTADLMDEFYLQPRWFSALFEDLYIVIGSIMLCLSIISWTQESERLIDDLRDLSHRDYLTKVYNRRGFRTLIEQQLNHAQRHHAPLSLLCIDIDDFKLVNDQYGHNVGDELLIALADTMSAELRQSDILARTGGDEFEALLPESSIDQAAAIANRIRNAIDQNLHNLKGATVSIGVAEYYPGETFEDLRIRADKQLLRVKQQGKGDFSVAQTTER